MKVLSVACLVLLGFFFLIPSAFSSLCKCNMTDLLRVPQWYVWSYDFSDWSIVKLSSDLCCICVLLFDYTANATPVNHTALMNTKKGKIWFVPRCVSALSITWSNTESLRYCYNTVFSRHFYCISRGGFECLGFGYHCKNKKCLCTKAMCLRQLCTLMQSASKKFGAVMKNE